MSSSEAPRCRQVKVNGTQCGSPAVRSKSFCFYHQQHRPIVAECYSDGEYSTGEILLPVFEDAHSVQSVIRQVMQMAIQERIERIQASCVQVLIEGGVGKSRSCSVSTGSTSSHSSVRT